MSGVSIRKFLCFKLYINNLSNRLGNTFVDSSTCSNLNDLDTGIYNVNNYDGKITNVPFPGGSFMCVVAKQGDLYKYLLASVEGSLATKSLVNGSWSSWAYYALKSDLYPSYNRSILFSDLKADVTDQSITITKDGMVQAVAKTQAIGGTAFIRFVVNNTVVYEGHTASGTYRYLWTPIFPVKKGDIIKVTLQTTTTDGQRFVYFYKS